MVSEAKLKEGDYQQDLFGLPVDGKASPPRLVTQEDIGQLSNVDGMLADWYSYREGPRLDLIVGTIMETSGLSKLEALQCLTDHFPWIKEKVVNLDVSTAHLIGRQDGHVWSRLRKVTGKNKPLNTEGFYRLCGTHGHGMVLAALTEGWLDSSRTNGIQLCFPEDNAQMSFFPGITHSLSQLPLEDVFDGRFVKEGHLHKIEDCLEAIRAAGVSSLDILRADPKAADLLSNLYTLMHPLVPNRVTSLKKHSPGLDGLERLIQASMVGWGWGLMEKVRNGHEVVLGREIQDLSRPSSGVVGGRIDAVKLRPVGRLSRTEREALGKLANKRFRSIGELDADNGLLEKVQITVEDFKFLFGDLNPAQITAIETVGPESMQQSFKQLRLSTARAFLDFCAKRGLNPQHHLADNPFSVIRIKVPLTHGMVTAERRVSPTELEEDLSRIARKWGTLQRRAFARGVDRVVINFIGDLHRGKRPFEMPKANEVPANEPIIKPFRWQNLKENPVIEGIKAFRQFLNGDPAIEVLGRTKLGETLHALYVPDLIASGRLPKDFFLEGGDKRLEQCPFPDHEDSTASGHYSTEANASGQYRDGFFYCFGCRRKGVVKWRDSGSLEIDFSLPLRKGRSKVFGGYDDFTVDDWEHFQLVDTAHWLLNGAFFGSPGERYLREIRLLNPDRAEAAGAGYGDERFVIEGLLAEGFTYRQLFRSGIINHSPNASADSNLVRMLRDAGYTLEEITEPIEDKKLKEKVQGYPYFTLKGRVTFPLYFMRRYGEAPPRPVKTSIYGRLVNWESNLESRPKEERDKIRRRFHRKLSTRRTKIPHGGYRMEVLETQSKGDDRIRVLAEAVLDERSIVEMGDLFADVLGYDKTGIMANDDCLSMAVIGLDNETLWTEVARANKPMAIAYDGDKEGRRATIDSAAKLRKLGHTAPIYDLTKGFLQANPHLLTLTGKNTKKDYNGWFGLYKREIVDLSELTDLPVVPESIDK